MEFCRKTDLCDVKNCKSAKAYQIFQQKNVSVFHIVLARIILKLHHHSAKILAFKVLKNIAKIEVNKNIV